MSKNGKWQDAELEGFRSGTAIKSSLVRKTNPSLLEVAGICDSLVVSCSIVSEKSSGWIYEKRRRGETESKRKRKDDIYCRTRSIFIHPTSATLEKVARIMVLVCLTQQKTSVMIAKASPTQQKLPNVPSP